jgi:chromosome segregation ATPase
MSDRDAEHLLNELQEARSEIDKLRLGVGFAKEILVQLQSEKKALEASALQSNAEVLELIKSNEKLRGKNNKLSEILEYIRDKTEIGDYAP